MTEALDTILVPVDGSAGANAAARRAASLAKQTGAHLTLLYVYDSTEIAALGLVKREVDDVVEIEKRARQTALDAATAVVAPMGISAGHAVRTGNPAEQIVEYAEEHDVDLIVIGSRGRGRMKALLLGSVSHRVAERARCPVMIHRERG